jgi:hypothetical protein
VASLVGRWGSRQLCISPLHRRGWEWSCDVRFDDPCSSSEADGSLGLWAAKRNYNGGEDAKRET